MKTELNKIGLSNIRYHIDDFYNVLVDNRARLVPWFWWADTRVTPNKFRFSLFIILYMLDTKRKEIMHKINHKNEYDEQFIVNVDGKFSGMIGLDNINDKNAEVWGFVSRTATPFVVADESIKLLEDYCIKEKGLKYLYAKTQVSNRAIKIAAHRNNYKIKNIEYGIRISKRNPKISDIITWEKQLIK